jgi:putative hydrolase of the HAD superfamily
VEPALERARAAGWRSMIVSNHIPELAALVAALDLTRHFDAIVSSGVVGYEKPHRRLFEAALRHVRAGEEVWMIGDNPDADCHPVCAIGMHAVLVRGTTPGTFEREAPGLLEALAIVAARAGGSR